jgi:hypothetical protein
MKVRRRKKGKGKYSYRNSCSTRYQAEPGNADPEALPPIFIIAKSEAEPLDIG